MDIRDSEALGQVRHAIARDPLLDSPKITITMTGETIALAGVVDTTEEVTRAGQVAKTAAPGIPIDNGLTVGTSHNHHPNEA